MSKETAVEKLRNSCLNRGVTVTVRDAQRYLSAKKILREKPDDPAALLVVNNFMEPLRVKPTLENSFAKFLVRDPPKTPEQEAEEDAADREYVKRALARLADINPEVVSKCSQARVIRAELINGVKTGYLEGIRKFKSRTKLSDAQILAMPAAELAAYA